MSPAEREELFGQALSLPPEERAAFLEDACRGEPETREELLSLLAVADEARPFFDSLAQAVISTSPWADDPAAEDGIGTDPMIGRTLRQYRIEEVLGRGGMGVVYRARDTRLDRTVALKFLPPHLGADEAAKERFLVEARAAAALDHPNVCAIYEIGEDAEGRLFIAMAHYEGETLTEKIARGPLEVEEAARLTIQAASGLAVAHAAGLVHRDIKPANLIITEGGVLKILDFGLAKMVASSLTEAGMRLGTPAYMSPEQTRGEEVQGSTDLWSLGVVLYEMLTGRRPFRGERNSAVINAIRHEEPERPGELRAALPPEVERLILRLLQKDPAARRVSAKQLSKDLADPATLLTGRKKAIHILQRHSLLPAIASYAVVSWIVLQIAEPLSSLLGFPLWFGQIVLILLAIGLPVVLLTAFAQAERRSRTGRPSEAKGIRRLFTWRRAMLGGAAAFTLLGVGTAGYMGMRSLGIGPPATLIAQGRLEDRGEVLVAEFANRTRDPLLAPAITEALKIDLAQSPVVRVVQAGEIAAALRRMEEAPDARLDLPLAREVAVREGIGAIVAGTISQVGSGYVLSAQLVSARGEVLSSGRETAADSTEVIAALDRLSKKMRERIGEPLRSVRRSLPLSSVTTANLAALKNFAQAQYGGLKEGSMAFLEEAISLDTTFAAAWSGLANMLGNRGEDRQRATEAHTTAYRLRDRLPNNERHMITAQYHSNVTGEMEKAIETYQSILSQYDLDEFDSQRGAAALTLGVRYMELRQFARATEMFRDLIELVERNAGTPTFSNLHVNFARAQANLGEYDEALAILSPEIESWRVGPYIHWPIAMVVSARGDFETAKQRLTTLLDVGGSEPFWQARASAGLAAVAAVRGRLAEAERHTRRAMESDEGREQTAGYLDGAVDISERALELHRDTSRALQVIEDALTKHPLVTLAPLDRPYMRLASLYARAGRVDRARELTAEFESEESLVPPGPLHLRSQYYRTLGEIALASADYEEAVTRFRQSDVGPCVLCALPGLARAHDRAGDEDSALVLHERYISTPYAERLFRMDQVFLGPAYERLGQLYDERDDPESAATYYAKFVALWQDADEALRSRVAAAQRRLEAICTEGACGTEVGSPAGSTPPTTGSLTVHVSQSGDDLDMNGFALRVDLTENPNPLWAADPLTKKTAGVDTVSFSGLSAGPHTVTLVDVWGNCEAEGDAERTVTVVAGGTAETAFQVVCFEEPDAKVDVTGRWEGRWEVPPVRAQGDGLLDLELVGKGVVGTYELVYDDQSVTSLSGRVRGRISENLLTLYTDIESTPGKNPGRIYWFLDVSGTEMAGKLGWDSYLENFGTTSLRRQ
jgi:serine/threonine protein kinase/tetratricopeptide (TPR) repeat protein